MKKWTSIFLIVMMMFGLHSMNVLAENVSITPTDSDYAVSGSKITGLNPNFLNALTADEKLAINLVIPDSINGITITEIGDNAFKSTTGVRVIGLDLSRMKNLKRIGSWAFYNNSAMQGTLVFPETLTTIETHAFDLCGALTGDLIIPNSVTSMGTYAFSGCKSMKGTLTLSNQLTMISNYAFKDAGFTGQLIIPESVKTIKESAFRQSDYYQGFSGTLMIPDSVMLVEKVAFSYQSAITDVVFSKNMTSIPESMFNYCSGLSGAMIIPEQIQTIGRNAFSYTSLTNIYLPKMKDQGNTTFVNGRSFYTNKNLTALIVSEEDYAVIRPLLNEDATVQKKLTYEKDIAFKTNEGESLNQSITKLYGLAYHYVKQSNDTWTMDATYELPKIKINDKTFSVWALEPGSRANITTASIVGAESSLYPVNPLALPFVTFGKGIDKVYDGNAETLKVTATHPDAVPIGQAKNGDVVFYYEWQWLAIGGNIMEQKGFDLDTCDITEVRADYGVNLQVSVNAAFVEGGKAKIFHTNTHIFPVDIRRADPTVNPVVEKDIALSDHLPSISLKEGDTEGTIAWDNGQSLQQGTHAYNWTYSPPKNSNGFYNYKSLNGTMNLRAGVYDIEIDKTQHGQIITEPASEVFAGSDLTVQIQPDPGYQLASLTWNQVDYTNDVKFNKITFRNVQSKPIIAATFVKTTVDNVGDLVDKLPPIDSTKPVDADQINAILEAKENLELLNELHEQVSRAVKDQMNELISSLPQVNVEHNTTIKNNTRLLDNMTADDAQVLLQDPNATLRIDCNVQSALPTSSEEKKVQAELPDAKFTDFFQVHVEKTITANGLNQQDTLSTLASPIQLGFTVPSNIPPLQEGYTRKFYVVRIHEEGGKQITDILENESDTENEILISSDKFSLFAIAYMDIPPKTDPEPSDPIPGLPSPGIDELKPAGVPTGDSTSMLCWVSMGAISLVSMFIVKQRKSKE